ncbi:hypothetical protein D3C81_1193490 [compost metagenome]
MLVLLGGHRGVPVPAEGVQGFVDKRQGIVGIQATIALELLDQLQRTRGEDLPAGENLARQLTQRRVVDQLQAQQRGEDPERADVQRLLVHGAKGGGMHRYTGAAEVVVPDWLHAHHREQAADGCQLFGGADANGAVAFLVEALDFTGPAQGLGNLGLLGHDLLIDFAHQ